MTPRPPDAERLPSLSRRALVLGSAGVLVAAAAMATLGFTGEQTADPTPGSGQVAAPDVSGSQLTTLSLTEVRAHLPLGSH